MNKLKFLSFGTAVLAALTGLEITTSPVLAQGVFCGTLAELFGGQNCQVGDKVFSNWVEIFNPQVINPNDILVEGIFPNSNAPGIKFTATNNALTVGGGNNIDFTFDFRVTSLGEPIVDNELSLDQFLAFLDPVGGLAEIEIFENVGTSQGSSNLASKSVEYEEFGITPPGVVRDKRFDGAVFSPQQSIWVRKDLNIISGGINGVTGLNMFSQRFSQEPPPIPEPSTVLGLLTISGIGLGLKKKK